MGTTAQTGTLKAEIISCDQHEANPATVCGSWKNDNWAGDLVHADEDMVQILGTPITVTANAPENILNYTFMYYNTVQSQNSNEFKIYQFNQNAVNNVNLIVTDEYGYEAEAEHQFTATYDLTNVIKPKEITNNTLLKGFDIEVLNCCISTLYRGTEGWNGIHHGSLVVNGTYFYVVHCTQPDGNRIEIKYYVFVRY
jgi:hypothetical protein